MIQYTSSRRLKITAYTTPSKSTINFHRLFTTDRARRVHSPREPVELLRQRQGDAVLDEIDRVLCRVERDLH